LPGKPDLVFPKFKTVVFVHGCFWHQHEGCRRARRPSTRKEWWDRKLERNTVRDQEKEQALTDQGWKVLVAWECEIMTDPENAAKVLKRRICRAQSPGIH
jgi:DNA mismatch endonuclease (patch repair protein)